MIKRTKENFFEKISIKDHKTVYAYEQRIQKWEKFLIHQGEKIDYIPKTKEDSIDIFQLFVNWLSKDLSANTVWNYASSIRKFLFYLGAPLTRDDIQEYVELPRKMKKELHGLNIEEIQRILDSLCYDNKVLFLCQLSSGMRIGELVQLQKKHLNLETERIMVKIQPHMAKFKKGRTTFFSKEAGNLLRVILKRKEENDLIFGTSKDVRISESNKGESLRRVLKNVGLDQKYDDTGNFQINTHSFRAYFITKISRHDANLAKFFSGQEGYLLQYDRMTDEEKLENYMEFEKDLLVYDLVKKDEEIKKLRMTATKISELEQKLVDSDKKIALLQELMTRSKRIA